MGFSSRLKAHKNKLTLETLKFICEYIDSGNAKLSALNSGIPETYAARQGQWLKKQPVVVAALERELDSRELQKLRRAIEEINAQMETCKTLLGLEEFD